MSYIMDGETEYIGMLALDAALLPLTGLTDLLLSIRRLSDDFWFDFADLTFKNAGWTTRQLAMSEVSAALSAGEYLYPFNTSTIVNSIGADVYYARVDQSPGTNCKNVPQDHEIRVREFTADYVVVP